MRHTRSVLFLLNEHVLDLGDAAATLLACGAGDPARLPGARRVIEMGQEAAYVSNGFTRGHPNLGVSLACMLTLTTQANCALFVCPARAQSARAVAVQFAFAPLTTLAYLADAQDKGRLNAAMINAHVWRLAGRSRAA